MACTSTPSSRLRKPTIRSPGTGWQQIASLKPTPGVRPRIEMARSRLAQSASSSKFAVQPGTNASITSRSSILAAPMANMRSSSCSISSRPIAPWIAFLPTLAGTLLAISSKSLRPISATSACSFKRTARRIAARALPVTTKPNHDNSGSALLPLIISTTSPLASCVRSGICRPLIFVPKVAAPKSVWTAKAKSTGVAPIGNWNSAPFGVKAKIRSW